MKENIPQDQEEIATDLERRKMFLRYVNRGWLILGIVALVTLPIFPDQRSEFTWVMAMAFPTYLLIRILNSSGKTRWAGLVFTLVVNFGFYGLFLMLVDKLGAHKAFDTEATVWMLMGLAVLFAGAFVDKWAAPVVALFNTILLIATRLTLAPGADPRPSALLMWWMLALTIWLYEGTLSRALGRVWAELGQRKQSEEILREGEKELRELFGRVQRQAQELALLDKVRTAMAQELDLPVLLSRIVESIAETFGYTQVSLYLLEKEELILQHQVGYAQNVLDKIPLTRGISGRVARTGEAVWLEEVHSDPEFLEAMEGIVSEICVPLFDKGKVAGILNVESMQGIKLSEADLKLMTALSQHVGMAMSRARLYGDVQRQNRILSALQESTLAVMKQLGLFETLEAIISQAARLVNAEHGYVYLVQPDEHEIEMIQGVGIFSGNEYKGVRLKPGEGLAGKVWQAALPLTVQNYQEWGGRSPKFAGTAFHAVMGIPLTYASRTIGVLGLAHLHPDRQFSEEEVELLSRFAHLASIALENVQLYTQVQQELEERKQAEETLIESEERFRSLSEAAFEGIMIHDKGIILNANRAFADLFGYRSAEDLIGKNGLDTLTFAPESRELIRANLSSGSMEPLEIIVTRPDGSMFPAETQGRDITFNGRKLRVVAMRDITERKQAEEKIRKLSRAVEQSPASIVITNTVGEIEYVNPKFTQVTGFTSEAALGKNPRILKSGYTTQQEYKKMWEAITSGQEWHGEFHNKKKNGDLYWESAVISPISNDRGEITHFIAVKEDITGRKRAEETLRRRVNELTALYQTTLDIISPHDLPDLLNTIVARAVDLLGGTGGGMYLCDPEQEQTRCVVSYQTPNDYTGTVLAYGEGAAGTVAATGEPLIIDDYRTWEGRAEAYEENQPFSAVISVPMLWKGQVTGVIHVLHDTGERQFTGEDLKLLTSFANQAAVAVENAQLFNNLHRSNNELSKAYDATIEGWSKAMDLRDKETEGHTLRVTELTLRMAQSMGLKEEQIIHIRRGGLLHDIGKLGVPDNILLKHENLTDVEWEIMRKHPTYAYEMLSSITYLEPALDIPYCHHEKWDGTGYPRGLKGEQIPIVARIFAIVDVWDALTSDRPYRSAWTKEETLKYIKEQSGKYFDPQVVDVFLRLVADK